MSSELRVNKLTSRSGVGTVTFNDSGLIITGIATAATLDITGNATIAGVLSYDDVTNVDSVGIVTAAGGVDTNTIRGKTNNSNIAIGARASNGAFVHALTITPGRDVGVGDAAPDSNYGSNLSVHSTATDGARLKLSDGSTGKTNSDGLDIISTGSVAYFINRENADMVFYTNNTERVRVTSAGNLSLGNSSVAFPSGGGLQVYNASAPRIKLTNSTTGVGSADGSYLYVSGSDFLIENKESANMRFYTAATERMRINSSGVVTIGTTAAGSNAKFEVVSTTGSLSSATARINGGSTTTGAINTGASLLFAGHDGANGRDFASLFAGKENGTSGNHAAYLAFGTRVNSGSITEKMRIDSDGIVQLGNGGFGQTKVGGQSISGQDYSATVKIYDTRANMWGMQMRRDTSTGPNGIFVRAGNTSSNYSLYVCGTNESNTHLVCRGDGNVGMGVNSPSAKLHVNVASNNPTTGSPAAGSFLQVRADDATVGNGPSLALMNLSGAKETAWRISAVTASGNNGDLTFHGYAGGTTYSERMRITSSGNMGVGNPSPAYKLSVLTTGTTDTSLHLATTGGASDNGDATNSIRFTGGNNTRWANAKYEAFNHIFNGNGVEQMRIDSSGRLLVGTTAGAAGRIVHVSNSGSNSAYFHSTNGSSGTGSQDGIVMGMGDATNAYFWNYESGSIVFATSANERMRITSSGNVGLGGITNPSFTTGGGIHLGDNYGIGFGGGGNNRPDFQIASVNGSKLSFRCGNGADTADITMDTAGRLMVGTETEGHPNADNLTVADSGDCGITIRSGTTSNGRIYFSDGTSGGAEYNGSVDYDHANNSLAFFTTGGQRMRIDSLGGVYIGASSDYNDSNYSQTSGSGNFYYKKDSGSAGGTIIASNNADRGWSLAYFNKFAYNSGDDNRFIAWYVNGTSQATINWNGSSVVYAGNSDYRLKTNASDYAGGIDKVKQLQVREYEWIDNPDAGRCVGFYAHELQEIFPEAVTGVKDGMKIDEFTEEEVPEYQGIDYGKITPLLTKALQEAIAKIETLEAKVAALEG